MRGTKRSKEAQGRATGKGQGGKGLSQDPSRTFLLLFFVMLMAFILVIWPSLPQHLLGCLLAQYVVWLLRCGNVYVGLDVFGSLAPMAAAALLAVALRARGLRVLLPFTAEDVSVARLLAYAAASLMIIGVLLPLAPPSVAALAVKGLSRHGGHPGPLPRLRGTNLGRCYAGYVAEGSAPSLASREGRALAGRRGIYHGPSHLAPRRHLCRSAVLRG
jgi:hypothetical protein